MSVRSLPEYKSDKTNYIHVDNVDKFVEETLQSGVTLMAVDTETYYNPQLKAPEVVTKFLGSDKSPNNVPFGVSFFWDDTGYWVDKDLHKLKPILENPDIEKIFHNSKYDIFMLMNIGITVKGKIWDTMGMIHLIDEEFECKMPSGKTKKSKALKNLAYHFLGDDAHELEDLVSEYRRIMASNRGLKKADISYKDVNDANPELMKDYAVADTEFTFKLYHIFMPELAKQRLFEVYDIDMNALWAVIDMERKGVKVDTTRMQHDEERLNKLIDKITKEIFDLVGNEFNVNSDREVVQAFNTLGITWEWFTEKEEYKTDKNVLKGLIKEHKDTPIAVLAQAILDYRNAEKLLSTYIVGVYPLIQEDGRVHADYWIYPSDYDTGGTVTGRLSSSNPNLQNIPKKPVKIRDEVFTPRAYYVADDDYIMVFMDADQEEYRLLAHYGNDSTFMELVHKEYDIHRGTASLLFGVPYEEVDDDLRSKGKTCNFALVYGLGIPSFAKVLGHNIDGYTYRTASKWLYSKFKPWDIIQYREPVKYILTEKDIFKRMTPEEKEDTELMNAIKYFFSEEVQAMVIDTIETRNNYFNQFPGIKKFLNDCKGVAKRRGYVKTWTGRRRHFKEPAKENYKAPNSVIQGGCGDILKVKMGEVYNFFKDKKSFIFQNTHDELGFMIYKDELETIFELNRLLRQLPFKVPITWGIEVGFDWHNKEEIKATEEVKQLLKGA